jgi:cytochrome c556
MSKRYLIIAAVCALSAAGLAQTQSQAQSATISVTADGVVKARQASFVLSAADFGAMKHLAEGTTEVKDLTFNAAALRRWAHTLPNMFPAGTGADQPGLATRARAEIWSDRAGFDKAAANYAAEADKLFDAAKANDKPAFIAQWAVVDQTCNACHTAYRAKPAAKPAG